MQDKGTRYHEWPGSWFVVRINCRWSWIVVRCALCVVRSTYHDPRSTNHGIYRSTSHEARTTTHVPRSVSGRALIIQTDALNNAGHPTLIVIPGTSDIETLPPSDTFPLRVRAQKTGKLKYDTDLLIDQVRAISARRLMVCYCTLGANHLKKVEEALRLLTGR